MSRQFTEEYVQGLRRESARLRVKLKDRDADRQLAVRLSSENLRLRDQIAQLKRNAGRTSAQLERRNQTINALRMQLTERSM